MYGTRITSGWTITVFSFAFIVLLVSALIAAVPENCASAPMYDSGAIEVGEGVSADTVGPPFGPESETLALTGRRCSRLCAEHPHLSGLPAKSHSECQLDNG